MSTHHDARPLVATDDLELLDDVLRLAAAAGVEPVVATSAPTLRSRWGRHLLVIVGPDIASQLTEGYVPRRPGVVIVDRAVGNSDRGWQIATELGAEQVAVLPAAEAWLIDRLAEIGLEDRAPAPVVGVIGACGGAGASSLVTAVAIQAGRQSMEVTAVDLDPFGCGLELLFGEERPAGLGWNDLAQTRGRLRGDAVRSSLPQAAGARILGWGASLPQPLSQGSVGAAIDALTKSCSLVVIDLPRRLDDTVAEALCRCQLVVMVVPKSSAAVASAGRVLASRHLEGHQVEVVARGPSPGGLLASDVADALDLPLLCDVAADVGLARRAERGLPPRQARGGLQQAGNAVLARLARDQVGATRKATRPRLAVSR